MSVINGKKLSLTLFGESHGEAVGVCVTGLPSGFTPDIARLDAFLQRRRCGSGFSTPRKEADTPHFLSGIDKSGRLNGFPLCITAENQNTDSTAYDKFRDTPRPGHADLTAKYRYGENADMSGGGHFSARLTLPLCFAGGIIIQLLEEKEIYIKAEVKSIGGLTEPSEINELLTGLSAKGDTIGAVANCTVSGLPKGIGGPYFEGLEGKLAYSLFAIPAVKGVEFGGGFELAAKCGSQANDGYTLSDREIRTLSNNCGGILGGISNGEDIVFSVAFKPIPSVATAQKSVNTKTMSEEEITVTGRHDVCALPRALPVIEAVTAITIFDLLPS